MSPSLTTSEVLLLLRILTRQRKRVSGPLLTECSRHHTYLWQYQAVAWSY